MAQTFKDFEVILVDDCSTDSSCAIVESYREKFGGRLKLSRMKKNSGGCALPRNKGLSLSRGEYIFFMDADDMFTKTALEELYTLAKNYDADFIYIKKYYDANDDLSKIILRDGQNGAFVDKPTLEAENLIERVQEILRGRYAAPVWQKFVRRDLMIENEIFFPHVKPGEDDLWTYALIFYAKKILRVPNAVYIRRRAENSIMRSERTPQQTLTFWLNPVIGGLKALDKFMSKFDFFKQNPQYRYAVLEMFFAGKIFAPYKYSWNMPPVAIYETIKKEFDKALGEQDVLVSALCTYVITLQKNNAINVQKFNQFAAQAQQRIAQLEAELGKKT